MKKTILTILLLIFLVGCSKPMKELSCCTICLDNNVTEDELCLERVLLEETKADNFCKVYYEENNADVNYCRQQWSAAK